MTAKSNIKRVAADGESISAEKAVQCDVYDSFERLRAIQQQWDQFVESVGSEIFLTYDWCRIWWKNYGKNRDLRVFVFRSNKKLVGIIPLFLEKIWIGPTFLRVAKIVGSDFTLSQFSIPLAYDYMRAVVETFSEIISQYKWDIIHIGPIAGLYNHCDGLEGLLNEFFGDSNSVVTENGGVQTYFELTNTWEEYLAGLKKKERQLIRSGYRKIDGEKLTLSSELASNDNFTKKFDSFADTHRLHWQRLGEPGHFGDWPDSFEFHREVASVQLKHNRLSLLEIWLSDDCFAYQYSYEFGNRCFELLTGRSLSKSLPHIDLGRIVFAEQAKNAMNKGVYCIDSMRGEYEYKLRLGGKLFPMRKMFICSKKPSVLIRMRIFRALARILNLFYYKIWFCRVAPKLPFKRKPLRNIWIKTHFSS